MRDTCCIRSAGRPETPKGIRGQWRSCLGVTLHTLAYTASISCRARNGLGKLGRIDALSLVRLRHD
jgi:hypothetical protein